ncbi:hypothetical protein UFOVP330_18 [uncultured Caudovirales phage]|uniref:Uncharacterized protein n=1 Tax=uncultured Caudovirales phage TaxID=2100421 RepID=A0A6J5M349_9CAUD|nr:hypothetical protein UFOVP330_18 [uncultured Caudovirales phage]
MSDDDLIRRGDALNAIKPIYGWSITAAEGVWDAIAALPAQGVDAIKIADEVFDHFEAKGATAEAFGAAEVSERLRAALAAIREAHEQRQ